jgi:hypothetical protein
LVHRSEGRGISRTNEISDLHVGRADAPGDRRDDFGVAELHAQIAYQCFVGLDAPAQHVRLRLGIFNVELSAGVLLQQCGVTRDIARGAGELRLVARQHALRLHNLRLDRAPIEREQQVALLHLCTVDEVNADDFALETRLDGDTGDRHDGAKRFDPEGNLLLDRGRSLHRHDAGRLLGTRGSLRRPLRQPGIARRNTSADEGEHRHPRYDPSPFGHQQLPGSARSPYPRSPRASRLSLQAFRTGTAVSSITQEFLT